MESRLKKAEFFTNEKKYKETLDELGGFQAIMRNTLGFLQKNDNGKGKVLSNFKRFEINLRKFVPRLETRSPDDAGKDSVFTLLN